MDFYKFISSIRILKFTAFRSVLYGGLGSEIGLAILNSITGQGVFHSGDGLLLPSEHPVHTKTHECFIHHPETTPILEALRFTFQVSENFQVASHDKSCFYYCWARAQTSVTKIGSQVLIAFFP